MNVRVGRPGGQARKDKASILTINTKMAGSESEKAVPFKVPFMLTLMVFI